mmetsp:Transcript_34420/g.75162  ORF Transcript_34420/g.75162 Transcript_34420/m.75162 type:complete len:222 (-) Transcript_34420:754-1419(-)
MPQDVGVLQDVRRIGREEEGAGPSEVLHLRRQPVAPLGDEPPEAVHDDLPLHDVERAAGVLYDQHLRAHDQGPRDLYLAGVRLGEPLGPLGALLAGNCDLGLPLLHVREFHLLQPPRPLEVGQDHRQNFHHLGVQQDVHDPLRGGVGVSEGDVVPGRHRHHPVPCRHLNEDHPEMGWNEDRARRWNDDVAEELQEAGLARAALAGDADAAALRDADADVLE